MYEIEAKVPIKKSDVQRLRKEIRLFAKLKGKSVKKDMYYGNPKAPFFTRIREKKGGVPIFNLKTKKVVGGMEMNEEIEFPVNSKSKFGQLLKRASFPSFATKEKHSEVYLYGSMQLELNRIPGLGNYLEIEYAVSSKNDIPKAKKGINAMFKKLGFSTKDFEKRYYLDMLAEKRRKK